MLVPGSYPVPAGPLSSGRVPLWRRGAGNVRMGRARLTDRPYPPTMDSHNYYMTRHHTAYAIMIITHKFKGIIIIMT